MKKNKNLYSKLSKLYTDDFTLLYRGDEIKTNISIKIKGVTTNPIILLLKSVSSIKSSIEALNLLNLLKTQFSIPDLPPPLLNFSTT